MNLYRRFSLTTLLICILSGPTFANDCDWLSCKHAEADLVVKAGTVKILQEDSPPCIKKSGETVCLLKFVDIHVVKNRDSNLDVSLNSKKGDYSMQFHANSFLRFGSLVKGIDGRAPFCPVESLSEVMTIHLLAGEVSFEVTNENQFAVCTPYTYGTGEKFRINLARGRINFTGNTSGTTFSFLEKLDVKSELPKESTNQITASVNLNRKSYSGYSQLFLDNKYLEAILSDLEGIEDTIYKKDMRRTNISPTIEF